MDQARHSNFEQRRSQIWRVNRRLLIGCAAAVALLVVAAGVANLPAQVSWAAIILAAGLIAITVFRVVRALNVLYRCPKCGILPYQALNEYKCGGLGPTRANFMSPRACPHCGTRIR